MLLETQVSTTRFLVYLQVYLKKLSRYSTYEDLKNSEFARISEFRPLPVVDYTSIETPVVPEPDRLELSDDVGTLEQEKGALLDMLSQFSSGVEFASQVDDETSEEVKVSTGITEEEPDLEVDDLGDTSDWDKEDDYLEDAGVEVDEPVDWGEDDDESADDWDTEDAEPDDWGDEDSESDGWDDDESDSEDIDNSDWGDVDDSGVDDDSEWEGGCETDEVEEPAVSQPVHSTHSEPSVEVVVDSLPTYEELHTVIFSSSYVPRRSAVAYKPKPRVSKGATEVARSTQQVRGQVTVPNQTVAVPRQTVTAPPPPMVETPVNSSDKTIRRESEDIVAYARRQVRVSEDVALKHFSPKEIEQALKLGKIMRRRGVLIFAHN